MVTGLETLRNVVAAGASAGRVLIDVPGDLARHGAPLVGRVVAAAPDPWRAREAYRVIASSYDLRTAAGDPYRRKAVDRLAARPGEVVLDVGCGTGLNFPALEEAIGPAGRLIGVDLSPEMLDQARERVARHGWTNVVLLHGTAEDADIPTYQADALLLCGVHDVMRSPRALAHVLRHLRPGGRVVAAGPKWVGWWEPGSLALNFATWTMNREYVTTFEGFHRPWSHLARLLDLEVEEVYGGGGYIAAGPWDPGGQ